MYPINLGLKRFDRREISTYDSRYSSLWWFIAKWGQNLIESTPKFIQLHPSIFQANKKVPEIFNPISLILQKTLTKWAKRDPNLNNPKFLNWFKTNKSSRKGIRMVYLPDPHLARHCK